MNKSEILVDKILTDLGIEHRKLPELGEPTPDFEVRMGSLTSYWEVKEFVENPYEKEVLEGRHEIYSINSDRIEDRVKSASVQFKGHGATDKPCVVVLCDNRIQLQTPFGLAWLYIYNHGVSGYPEIRSGEWFPCRN